MTPLPLAGRYDRRDTALLPNSGSGLSGDHRFRFRLARGGPGRPFVKAELPHAPLQSDTGGGRLSNALDLHRRNVATTLSVTGEAEAGSAGEQPAEE